jgi:pimeloyl-ACP methyl ester carboxylesterase
MRLKIGVCGVVCAILISPIGARAAVVDIPLRFTVQVQNHSVVPCPTAGSGTATIVGELIAPKSLPDGVTLYLHGLGFARWFWSFRDVAGLDYATELAEAGHASVIIDRLGYGDSSQPDGNQSCLGVQADIADQIARKLRNGFSYTVDGRTRTASFARVALAGHSAGAATAEVAAYSFPNDFDALVFASYADQGASPDALAAFAQAGIMCLTGSTHYADFGPSQTDFNHLMFDTPRALTGKLPIIDSDPTATNAVIDAVDAKPPSRDPCGDDNSIPFEIVISHLLLSRIKVPVLLVCGEKDVIFPQPACDLQAFHFRLNSDFTHATISGGGHALTLGTRAADFRKTVSDWLSDPRRGF